MWLECSWQCITIECCIRDRLEGQIFVSRLKDGIHVWLYSVLVHLESLIRFLVVNLQCSMREHICDNIRTVPPRLEFTRKESQSRIVYQYLLSDMKFFSYKVLVVIRFSLFFVKLGIFIGIVPQLFKLSQLQFSLFSHYLQIKI
jgi:hypothetical protein